MYRRALLRASLPALAGVLAGCTRLRPARGSVDPHLRIRNRRDEEVTLDIVLFSDLNNRGEKVTERSVTVQASSTEAVEIFGHDQYEVHVSYNGITAEFKTRPICNTAKTEVIIHDDGAISSEVEWCEGIGPTEAYATPIPSDTETTDVDTVESTTTLLTAFE